MYLISKADRARDSRRFRDAAVLYAEAVSLKPRRGDIHIQAGHMFKEARDFRAAERHYLAALRMRQKDPDLALQLGHFYKLMEQNDRAVVHYSRATQLKPGWAEALRELGALEQGSRQFAGDSEDIGVNGIPLPELLPQPFIPATPLLNRIEVRRLGQRNSYLLGGKLPLLSGMEAVRGVCFSNVELCEAQLSLDGQRLLSERVSSVAVGDDGLFKCAFNLWVDFGPVERGMHLLEVVLTDGKRGARRHAENIFVGEPPREADHPGSDRVIELSAEEAQNPEQAIRARPSMVRAARRQTLPEPKSILVLRTDQIGDVVVSVPGLCRLRELFPAAKIVGLLTSENSDLAEALGLFDEVVVADFPTDPKSQSRTMTAAAQKQLQDRLRSYAFDIAIDLAGSGTSRPLLQLSGAKFVYGFHGHAWPWMDGGLTTHIHDPVNHLECANQSDQILTLVERLGLLVHRRPRILPRQEGDEERLARYGIVAGERFVVLHAGARLAFSRWHGFPALALELLRLHDIKLFLMTDDPGLRARLPEALAEDARFTLIAGKLPFADFDALLAGCSLFVGNDSGPKHLASLRGSNVISLHCARLNWSEWGQEQTGLIISRRVPCAGCAIPSEADECTKNFSCIADISVEEVLREASAFLGEIG